MELRYNRSSYFPRRSKCEALGLGIQLILLYFIRIFFWVRRLFFILMVGGGWARPTFWFFTSLNNIKEYNLGVDVYLNKRNRCTTKVLWVLKF